MQKSIRLLTVFLVAQLAITGLLYVMKFHKPVTVKQNLISFDAASCDEVVIEDQANSLVLKRVDDQWLLPEYYSLVVEPAKQAMLFEKLGSFAPTWPVTTSESSLARFEVADDNFQRRVALKSSGKEIGVLYFGTSPGLRKTHVRAKGGKEVFEVNFSNFDIPVAPKHWFDKSLLQPKLDFVKIRGKDFELNKEQDNWQIALSDDAGSLNQEQLQELLGVIKSLLVLEVASVADVTKLAEQEPTVNISLMDKEQTVSYSYYQLDDKAFVKSSLDSKYFVMSKYTFDRVAQIDRNKLMLGNENIAENDLKVEPVVENKADSSSDDSTMVN